MSLKNFECVQHNVQASYIRQYPRATAAAAHSQDEDLYLAVKQYKVRHEPQPGDVTLLACHANGYPKELYEPLWDALYEYTQTENAGFRLRGIWIMDVANQGDSGMLNEGKLGNEPSWHDFARDYLALVNQFRKEMPRPIVGFGHSMGGSVILDLALLHPRLLTSVITFEPTARSSQEGDSWSSVGSITFRRDQWQSPDAAMDYFRKAPIHKRWDPKVLELYRRYGLCEVSGPAGPDVPEDSRTTTLKTSKHQEALSFARASLPASQDHGLETIRYDRKNHPEIVGLQEGAANPLYRPESMTIFKQLPALRPSCLYLYGGESTFAAATPWRRKERMEATGSGPGGSGGAPDGRVKEFIFKGGSHFFPFEKPLELGQTMAIWMDEEMRGWHSAERQHSEGWSAVPVGERSAVSDDWLYWTKKLFKNKPSASENASKAKL